MQTLNVKGFSIMGQMSLLEFVYSITEKALFHRTPALYRLLYSLYKTITDRSEQALFKSLISPGMVVADIGANIGIYTGVFSNLVGQHGEIHAFEPDPTNFRLLANALSSQENVFLNQKAVGSKISDIFLYVSPFLNVDHRTYEVGDERNKISVACTSLDSYFNQGKTVDFIKIDIQGFEYQALLGMERVLQENQHIKIFMEYFPSGLETSGYSGDELLKFLLERGFLLYTVSKNGNLIPLEGKEPQLNSIGYTNIFAQRNP